MSIIEMLVAAFILLVAMGAALSVITTSIVQARTTRAVDLSSNFANDQVERYRSFMWDSIALGPDYTGGATHTVDGTTYPVVTDASCTACPLHNETVTFEGRDISVTRWVLGVDDPADKTGADDADGNTTDYKRLIIDLSWSEPTTGSQVIQTNILPDEAGEPAVLSGMRVHVVDNDTGELAVHDEDGVMFPVTVTDGSDVLANDVTIEGDLPILGLPVGSYLCTIEQANEFWHPVGDVDATSETFACNAYAQEQIDTNIVTRQWVYVPCLAHSGSADGTVTVLDHTNAPLQNVSVRIQGTTTGATAWTVTRTGWTNASGEVTFTSLPLGLYQVKLEHDDPDPNNDPPYGYGEKKWLNLCVDTTGGQLTYSFVAPDTVGGDTSGEGDGTATNEDPQACDPFTDVATLCVTVTNNDDEDHFFRLEIEPDDGDKFYEPDLPDGMDDKEHQGTLVAAGQSYTLVRSLDPVEYKKVRLQRKKQDGKWDKKEEWKEDDHWTKDVVWSTNTKYQFTAAVK